MNVWKTFTLVVVFAVLLGYTMRYERGEKPDHEADRTILGLLGFKDAGALDELTVQGKESTFTLIRERTAATGTAAPAEDRWKITAPIKTEGDATVIGNYIKPMMSTKAQYALSAEQSKGLSNDLSGLASPACSVTFKDDQGKTATLLFGAETPDKNSYYAQVKGDDRVLVFTKYFVDENVANKKLGDLRDKTLLSFLISDVKSITLQYPAETMKLEKKGEEWWLGGDKPLRADTSAVESLLSTLSSQRIDEFVEGDSGDLASYGLAEPRIVATLGLGSKGENGLLIGAEKEQAPDESTSNPESTPPPKKLYVQRKGDTEVVLVPGSLYDALLKTPEDLRDKTVLRVHSEDVTRVAYSIDGQEVEFQKAAGEKKDDAKPVWQLKKPAELPADEHVVSQLLSNVDLLRATGFVDDPKDLKPYGLDKPRGRIEITEQDKPLTALLLGKAAADGSGLFVKLADSPTVLKVRSSFVNDLETKPSRLRDLLVVKIDRTRVKKLTFRQENGDLCVVEATGDNAWKVTKPEEQEADSGRVAGVLTAIEELRANEWVTDKAADLKQYGLDKPAATCVVTLDDGSEQTILVGDDPKGSLKAYLKLKGKDTIYLSDNGLILTDLKKGPDDFKPFEQPDPGMMGMPPM